MCMIGKYIDPFTDFGFKRIFGNEKHKNIKEAFDVASFLALSNAYQMDMKAKIEIAKILLAQNIDIKKIKKLKGML